MELGSLIAAIFCVAVSFQLVLCASSDEAIVQKSLKQYGNSGVQQVQLSLPLLPRKLKLQEDHASVKSLGDNGHYKLMEASSGKKEKKKEEVNVVHAETKGTWREWVEGPNKSEYFTMDYSWVRRRRPIHNKQAPFLP